MTTIGLLVSALTIVGFLEASMWAGLYVWLDAIPTYSEAIYFSLVTFTTLGYGDVTLGEEWRVLGALESANGVIIFGWSTAMVVAVLQRTLVPDATDGAS